MGGGGEIHIRKSLFKPKLVALMSITSTVKHKKKKNVLHIQTSYDLENVSGISFRKAPKK